MADTHSFAVAAPYPRRGRPEIEQASEAIRRGVQYLAFRPHPTGLLASYEPGPGQVSDAVAQAAQAALAAHENLASDPEPETPSPTRSAALALRLRFARQLAEVKAGVTRAPATALRSAYLDALAEFMIEVARRDGA